MKLPLLDVHGEIPTRVPIQSRIGTALASGRDLGINANLPNQLPQAYMPADYGTEQGLAIARFGTTALAAVTQLGGLAMEGAIRTQDVQDTNDTNLLFYQASKESDVELEGLKLSEDHATFKSAYRAMFADKANRALEAAPNARVKQALKMKLLGLDVARQNEVNSTYRAKFEAYNMATYAKNTSDFIDAASKAATPAEYQFQVANYLSISQGTARQGLIKPDVIQAVQEKALSEVREERAKAQALVDPLKVLEEFSTPGMHPEYSTKERTNVIEYASVQNRHQLAARRQAEADANRQTAAEQDALAITYQTMISENYAPSGPKRDLLPDINRDARKLGKNHDAILSLNRTYQKDYLSPGPKRESDSSVLIDVQTTLMTAKGSGNLPKYSQADLARFYQKHVDGEPGLDETNWKRLSNELAEMTKQSLTERDKPKTAAEKVRDEQITEGKKDIEAFVKRSNNAYSDPLAQSTTGMLVRDGLTEYDNMLKDDPALRPYEAATQVIVRRIKQAEALFPTLPYKTHEAVAQAKVEGRLTKDAADRYTRMLRALGVLPVSEKPTPTGTTTTTPAPGYLQQGLDALKGLIVPEKSPPRKPGQ